MPLAEYRLKYGVCPYPAVSKWVNLNCSPTRTLMASQPPSDEGYDEQYDEYCYHKYELRSVRFQIAKSVRAGPQQLQL